MEGDSFSKALSRRGFLMEALLTGACITLGGVLVGVQRQVGIQREKLAGVLSQLEQGEKERGVLTERIETLERELTADDLKEAIRMASRHAVAVKGASEGAGSGVIVQGLDEQGAVTRYVLTNFHVLQETGSLKDAKGNPFHAIFLASGDDDREGLTTLAGVPVMRKGTKGTPAPVSSPEHDWALLELRSLISAEHPGEGEAGKWVLGPVLPEENPPPDVGASFVDFEGEGVVHVGNRVIMVGFPLGMPNSAVTGSITRVHRFLPSAPFADFIETDARMRKGNSGSGVFLPVKEKDASGTWHVHVNLLGIYSADVCDLNEHGGGDNLNLIVPSYMIRGGSVEQWDLPAEELAYYQQRSRIIEKHLRGKGILP